MRNIVRTPQTKRHPGPIEVATTKLIMRRLNKGSQEIEQERKARKRIDSFIRYRVESGHNKLNERLIEMNNRFCPVPVEVKKMKFCFNISPELSQALKALAPIVDDIRESHRRLHNMLVSDIDDEMMEDIEPGHTTTFTQ